MEEVNYRTTVNDTGEITTKDVNQRELNTGKS